MQELNSDKVKEYTCVGKPWSYEVMLEPDGYVNTTPPDLNQYITINGIKKPNTLLIIRIAEKVAISTEV